MGWLYCLRCLGCILSSLLLAGAKHYLGSGGLVGFGFCTLFLGGGACASVLVGSIQTPGEVFYGTYVCRFQCRLRLPGVGYF